MKAMVLHKQREPMRLEDIDQPEPQTGELLIRVNACGVCRTDLHVVDADLDNPSLPLVPGHQIIGEVVGLGEGVTGFTQGDRVGVPWLGGSCGDCQFCLSAQENLCDHAQYTGYQRNGGFAEYTTADAHYCFPVPSGFSDAQAAPLLCAGLIGHRAHRMAGSGKRLGLYGFGAAAHILIQVARHQEQEVFAFTRVGDTQAQDYALSLGAAWAGDSQTPPPQPLDAAIIFAPDGALVPLALQAVRKGGRVVCAGIHMSEIPAFSYDLLWEERSICSVANLTRRDGDEFLPLAAKIPVVTDVSEYPLAQANEALDDLRAGRVTGALVIRP